MTTNEPREGLDVSPWLRPAAGASLVVAGLLFFGHSVVVHVCGWVTGSILPIFLVALWRRRSQQRWIDFGIAVTPVGNAIATVILVGGLVLASWHGWFLARELA